MYMYVCIYSMIKSKMSFKNRFVTSHKYDNFKCELIPNIFKNITIDYHLRTRLVLKNSYVFKNVNSFHLF